MNGPDQTVPWFSRDGLQERLSAYEDAPAGEERAAADLPGGLVSLGFFMGALRRSARVWCLCAIAGLLIGSALYLKYPLRTMPPRQSCSWTTLPRTLRWR